MLNICSTFFLVFTSISVFDADHFPLYLGFVFKFGTDYFNACINKTSMCFGSIFFFRLHILQAICFNEQHPSASSIQICFSRKKNFNLAYNSSNFRNFIRQNYAPNSPANQIFCNNLSQFA